ncbi:MAG: MarC family transcriptional regulator [Pelagibacterales bacterium]|nr:MarC family transcriptional regulator [Pelagibacterales bacterium]
MLNEILDVYFRSFIFYFVVIDPLGTVAIFLTLLQRIKENKNKIAIEATFLAFLILVFFFIMGKIILNHLNISLYSFKIAGGIILLLIAIEMLLDKRSARKEKSIEGKIISTSIFPLAIPLLAGPAAITSVIVSSSSTSGNLISSLAHIFSVFSVLLITCMLFLVIIRSEKFISKKLLQVLSRIIGIILAALSVQFILDGLREASKTF